MIKDFKIKHWKALVDDLDRDPWGVAYKVIQKRIKTTPPFDGSLLTDTELYEIIYGLFPDHGDVEWERIPLFPQDAPENTAEESKQAIST